MIKNIKSLNLLSLVVILFLSGCATVDKTDIRSNNIVLSSMNTAPVVTQENIYGVYTSDIQSLLDATPIGSEIYLKEEANGEWHLRIEKIFTAEDLILEASKYFEDNASEENSEVLSEGNFYDPEIITI
jgi:uncharacterized protein YceK